MFSSFDTQTYTETHRHRMLAWGALMHNIARQKLSLK